MPRVLLIALCLVRMAASVKAQPIPVGQWRDHLPWASAIRVVNTPTAIWCATPLALYAIDKEENTLYSWSTLNGLPASGIRDLAWDSASYQIVVAHTNGLISLLSGQSRYSLEGYKNSTLSGDKKINRIFTREGTAYIATGIGLLIADLKKRELSTLAIIGNNGDPTQVNDIATDQGFLYAATDSGLKRTPLNGPNLSDYRNWELRSSTEGLPTGPVTRITLWNQNLMACIRDTLYRREGGLWSFFYASGKSIRRVTPHHNELIVCEQNDSSGQITILQSMGGIKQILRDTYWTTAPADCIWENGAYWTADETHGLCKYVNNTFIPYQPDGPAVLSAGKMVFQNHALWVAPHSVSPAWKPLQQPSTLSIWANGSWMSWSSREIPSLATLNDLIILLPDNRNPFIWGGSFGGGLFTIDENKTLKNLTASTPLQSPPYAPGEYRVSGLAMDPDQNLFVANYGAPKNIHVRKPDGSWKSFSPPQPTEENAIGEILIDDLNQKWIILPRKQGLLCWNHGTSIDNPADDRWKWLKSGNGNGNLPDMDVRCIAKDKNNFIWIGTASGIGIVQCPQDIFSNIGCEALIPVVKQGNFTGYLLQGEEVLSIAVDGADRKWVGTRNGAWLLSADGEKTLYHFQTGNSPLPDNEIRQIAIEGKSGEVFFETAKGICSFRGTATEGRDRYEEVLVFPNPVPPGYTGSIAIRGLVNNAVVKITELDGRLVYETRALGGQALWNGKNYNGQTVASGVYLVLLSDERQKEKMVTKIVFIGK